jgi:hypothetical protein
MSQGHVCNSNSVSTSDSLPQATKDKITPAFTMRPDDSWRFSIVIFIIHLFSSAQ